MSNPAGSVAARVLADRWFALARTGELPALLAALAVKKKALEMMRADGDAYDAFLAVLVTGLADRRPRVRFDCAHALDQFGDARCRDPLAALMDDPVPRVRWMAMHALSCHACGEETVSPDPAVEARIAQAAVSDPSIQVRRQAAAALGLAARPGAAPTLRRLIADDSDPKLVALAAWALEQCEARASPRP